MSRLLPSFSYSILHFLVLKIQNLPLPTTRRKFSVSSFKMFDSPRIGRVKLNIFSTVSFAILLLIIISFSSFVSNLSLHSAAGENRVTRVKHNHEAANSLIDDESVLPRRNLTQQERVKEKLGGVYNPRTQSTEFDSSLANFVGGGDDRRCRVKFFMTWISPVSSFGERESLAIRSLFNSNPKGCLIILSKTMETPLGYSILQPLLESGFRVLAITPDLPYLFNNTPAMSWFNDIAKGSKSPGEIPLEQNLSNLIRLAVLYKYGGVYLDTDVIVLKDFSGLRNSIGAQSVDISGNWTRLNNAVLIFDKNHPLLYKFMEEFASTFDGNKWGHNGPYLVSRVVKRMELGPGQDCNFTILPPMGFYPVDWTKISALFAKPVNERGTKWVEAKLCQLRRAAYGVHLWNKQSRGLKIEEGSIIDRLFSRT